MGKSDNEKSLIRWHEMRHNEELCQVSDELNQYKLKCSILEKELEFFKAKEMRVFENCKKVHFESTDKFKLGSSLMDTPMNTIIYLYDEIKTQENVQYKLKIENNNLRNLWETCKKQFEECQKELILTRKRLGCQEYQSFKMREVKDTFSENNQLDTLRLKYQNSMEENKSLKLRNKELSEQNKKLALENLNLNKIIEKTKNLTFDYETLKNELKTKEEELKSSIYNYKELSRQKIQEENIQQTSMNKIIFTDKKKAEKILDLQKLINDYKLQIDCLTNKINQIQYEHEIHNRDNAKELKDAQMHIKKLQTEKLKVPKNYNKELKKECELIKKQLSNKQTDVQALRSQIEQLMLDKRSLQHDACRLYLGKITKPSEEGKRNKILLKQNMIYRHDIQKLKKLNNMLCNVNKKLASRFKNMENSKKSTASLLSVGSYSSIKVPVYLWCERFLNDFKKKNYL